MQGVRGGKEGTALSINFLPLFNATEELDPAWPCGGEIRFLLGELTFSDFVGVEASFSISGVSSSEISEIPEPEFGFLADLSVMSKFVTGVIGIIRPGTEQEDDEDICLLLETSAICEPWEEIETLALDEDEELAVTG